MCVLVIPSILDATCRIHFLFSFFSTFVWRCSPQLYREKGMTIPFPSLTFELICVSSSRSKSLSTASGENKSNITPHQDTTRDLDVRCLGGLYQLDDRGDRKVGVVISSSLASVFHSRSISFTPQRRLERLQTPLLPPPFYR